MSDNATWMGFWICVAFTICFIVSLVVLPDINAPTDNEVMLKLSERGISPAVMECLTRSWAAVSAYEICKSVLTDNNLTREEAQTLVDKFRE